MPIAAALTSLKSQIAQVHNLKQSGNADTIAGIYVAALVAAAPQGLFPPGPSPVPLVPSGASALQNSVKQAHSLDIAADPAKCAQLIALGISQLVPNVPPVGLSKLQKDIENSLNLKEASSPDLIGTLQATAIVNYYLAAGVI